VSSISAVFLTNTESSRGSLLVVYRGFRSALSVLNVLITTLVLCGIVSRAGSDLFRANSRYISSDRERRTDHLSSIQNRAQMVFNVKCGVPLTTTVFNCNYPIFKSPVWCSGQNKGIASLSFVPLMS
jgi:hypothetical protein